MKLNYKRTILIGLAFLSISAVWQMYDNIIPLILKNTFGFKETVTGTIMALDNVLALFLLPFFGALSDKINTPIGKRMPFILIGTSVAAIALALLPFADMTKNLILFVVTLFVLLLALGFYRSPAIALMPDLTEKPLRSKGNAVINLMGAVGGLYALIMIRVFGGSKTYLPLFLSIAIFMIICIAVLFVTIKENKLRALMPADDTSDDNVDTGSTNTEVKKLPKEVKKSLIFILLSVFLWFFAYNALTTAFSRYATTVWKLKGGSYTYCLMIAMVSAIISYIPIGHIASRIGRKKTILIGIGLITLSYLCVGLYAEYHFSIMLFFCIIGFAWASIGVNSLPMVVDICSAGDIGKYTGYYYTFSMAAQVITPIFSGALLENIGYRILLPYAVFFSTLSFITMLMVKHGDSKPLAKKSVLENFDVED